MPALPSDFFLEKKKMQHILYGHGIRNIRNTMSSNRPFDEKYLIPEQLIDLSGSKLLICLSISDEAFTTYFRCNFINKHNTVLVEKQMSMNL